MLKKHWFTLALLAMVLMTIVKQKTAAHQNHKYNPVITHPVGEPKAPVEKFTVEEKGKSLFGIFPRKQKRKTFPTIKEDKTREFIKRFRRVVIAEQKKYGVPASVLMATALVNSFAGNRPCAKEANNYFAFSCEAVEGKRFDEDGACKTKLNTAWEGFRTFSRYLEIQPWYAEAKTTAAKDTKLWLDIFEAMELSDVEDFADEAKKIVLQYDLQSLDRP